MKNINWKYIALVSIINLALAYVTFEGTTYANISGLVGILQNTSVMIFTVLGIWIAYAYPKAKQELKILKDKVSQNVPTVSNSELSNLITLFEAKYAEVSLLLFTLFLSAFVLGSLLFGVFLKTLYETSIFYGTFQIENVKFISLFSLYNLVAIQLLAVYLVVAKNVNFATELHSEFTDVKSIFKNKR
ncbi:hypothetical protein GCM10009111_34440 [Colwellia asteriadis]|uniref:Uncharacterized protein n=1 Tax=Colwellia asteriadis TaxID=517723 RepID=A0ABP3WKQ2_9GAMM